LAVNEAMCFHLPIIISDLTGCGRDLVKQGENGFIFKTGNIEELTNRLYKLINDSNLRQAMGNNSFKIIEAWDYDKDIDGMLKALEHIPGHDI
ncbi:MAG: glycosyltransferase, partial [Candidatus Omnitrophica bacterium]|nr:glycosyltransferase [Candidatus Omnitrophota bacterium]